MRRKMITAGTVVSSQPRWLAPSILIALIVATELGGDALRNALRFDREAILAGQGWRLLTASFVHLGWYHAMLNILGLIVFVLLCPQAQPPLVWLRRMLLLSLGTGLGLLAFVPELHRYVGMSGVLHGLFLLGLVPQVRARDWIATGCLVYLFGKLGYEMWSGAPVSDEAAIGGRVIVESHLFGTLAALLYGGVFGSLRRHGHERWAGDT